MSGCPLEDLEAYESGALSDVESARVEAHLKSCPLCAEEVAWLRAEKRLFRARAEELPGPPPFAEVLERALAEPRPAAEAQGKVRAAPREGAAYRGSGAGVADRASGAGAARSRALRAAAFACLAAAAGLAGILFRSGEAPQPIVVNPEPRPTAAAAPLRDPSLPGEPEHVGNADCKKATMIGDDAVPAEPSYMCGDEPGAPEGPVEPRGMEECGDNFSVTCGGDRPLEE
jgi:anti-sigma factor RsiW